MPLLVLVLAALIMGAAPSPAPARPNVVVVMTDDQTYRDLAVMPITRRVVGDAGATFEQAYVSYPLCCPSRATFLTGQYAHNHGVRSTTPPEGGFERLDTDHTLPVWLSATGYDTIHIGKYLNGYGLRRKPDVPRGWTDWHGAVDKSTYQMYGYSLYENGALNTYGQFDVEDPALYQTDLLRDKAVDAIESHAGRGDPFFMSVNFVAPHGEVMQPGSTTQPYIRPAPRHAGRFAFMLPPRLTLGERDASDKPPYVQRLRPLGIAAIERITEDFQVRREALLAVDEAVGAIVDALARSGELDDTYLLFTSDNGFFNGEHNLPKGKYLAYEPSSHVPLLVRGPGITPGTVSYELISNTDLAPTILQATGARPDVPMDGRSLLPFARDGALRTGRPILHEGLVGGDVDRDLARRAQSRGRAGTYYAVRTDRYLYVKWRGGARELYDLWADPREMNSVHRDPRYAVVRDRLSAEVARLRRCAGAGCG